MRGTIQEILIFSAHQSSTTAPALRPTSTTTSASTNTSPSSDYGFSSISTSKNSRGWYGKIQEIVIYENTDYSDSTNRTGIESNVMTYFSIT